MKKHFLLVPAALGAAVIAGAVFAGPAVAEGMEGIAASIRPVRIADVTGDVEKFRAHTWMNDGYAGGINALSIDRPLGKGASMAVEVSAIPDNNEQSVDLSVNKDDVGAMTLRYQMFKKYFDHSGGYYYPFSAAFESNEAAENLDLDIGHFLLEMTPSLGDVYDMTFSYEHRSKDGKKSRLTWAEVKEGAVARNTAPSWQDIDETTDVLSVKGKTEIGGFSVSGQQNYEIVKSDTMRTEKFLSDVSGAGTKIRNQYQEPDAIVLTSVLRGEKWFNDEKSFVALAYRFHQINNKEWESIVETDEAGVPTNSYSSPKQIGNSSAENKLNSHSWIGHYMASPVSDLSFSVKSKVEMISKDSASDLNEDSTGAAPDGIINDQNINDTKNKVYKFGENFGFRYTGLSSAAIYGDVEIGYIRNNLNEEENDDNGTQTWFRETDTDTQRVVWTLGSRYVPAKAFNVTAQLRRKQELNDYDDKGETAGINSAFFEELRVVTNEATTKMTWKPLTWLQNSLRYQYLHKRFDARAESLDGQKALTESHTITLDTLYQPLDALLMNFSVSRQNVYTLTSAAADTSVSRAPQFDANVTSVMYSLSYAPRQDLSFTGLADFSFSDNFNDFTASALPLAVSNSRFHSEIGMRWAPKDKDWSVEPKYAYYDYNTHSESEFGDYRAHIAWLDFDYLW